VSALFERKEQGGDLEDEVESKQAEAGKRSNTRPASASSSNSDAALSSTNLDQVCWMFARKVYNGTGTGKDTLQAWCKPKAHDDGKKTVARKGTDRSSLLARRWLFSSSYLTENNQVSLPVL
jgi:hypothetical protein